MSKIQNNAAEIVITVVVILTMLMAGCTKPKVDNNFSEIINSAEDIIEWINHDIESGYLDSVRANTYIYNLEQMIKEIK